MTDKIGRTSLFVLSDAAEAEAFPPSEDEAEAEATATSAAERRREENLESWRQDAKSIPRLAIAALCFVLSRLVISCVCACILNEWFSFFYIDVEVLQFLFVLFVCLFVYLFVCLFVCLFFCMFVCLILE